MKHPTIKTAKVYLNDDNEFEYEGEKIKLTIPSQGYIGLGVLYSWHPQIGDPDSLRRVDITDMSYLWAKKPAIRYCGARTEPMETRWSP